MKHLPLSGMILVIITGLILGQGVPYNHEFQVNTYIEDDQGLPVCTSLPDGRIVITWYDRYRDGSDKGIFARILDISENIFGEEFLVNTYTANHQCKPTVASFPDNKFIVSWHSQYQDNSGYGVYAQKYESNGEKLGKEFQVNSYIINNQAYPSILCFADSRFLISWESHSQDGSVYGVYAQMFDENANKIGYEFQVNSHWESYQFRHSVATLPNSQFLICWQSLHQDGSDGGIYAQLFKENGGKYGQEFQVHSSSFGDQAYPSVAAIQGDRFVICWQSNHLILGSNYNIFAQVLDSCGSKIGTEFQVNTYTDFDQRTPFIADLLESGFLVCWTSFGHDGSGSDIHAQLFDNNGERMGPEFRVNDHIESDQWDASIQCLENGKFIVCWTSNGQDGSGRGVYAKVYLSDPITHTLVSRPLLVPKNDATLEIQNPTFRWNEASEIRENFPWEITYDLYIADNPDFTNPQIISEIQDTNYTIESELVPGTTYFWKVLARSWEGDSLWSSNTNGFFIDYDATTDIETETNAKPEGFRLEQNYPNPFNATTVISYELPASAADYSVLIRIYDLNGKLVATLINERQNPGQYRISWNATDDAGQTLPSGIYICSIRAGEFTATRKMVLLR